MKALFFIQVLILHISPFFLSNAMFFQLAILFLQEHSCIVFFLSPSPALGLIFHPVSPPQCLSAAAENCPLLLVRSCVFLCFIAN